MTCFAFAYLFVVGREQYSFMLLSLYLLSQFFYRLSDLRAVYSLLTICVSYVLLDKATSLTIITEFQ
jgi:hypothetical protein